jgi:hypothetical protein
LFARSPSKAVCVYVGQPEQRPAHAAAPPSLRSWSFDPSWLLSREREFPNDAPTLEEMQLWFGVSVLVGLGGAMVLTGLIQLAWKRWLEQTLPGTWVFLSIAFVLGALGPNLISAWADQCVFSWPVSVYAAFHGAVLTCAWAERQTEPRRARWLARLAVLLFALVGYGYFEACKFVGMFIAWSFLVGFPLALPFTWLAARATLNGQRTWIVAFWTLLAFSALFWSAQGLLLWKAGI